MKKLIVSTALLLTTSLFAENLETSTTKDSLELEIQALRSKITLIESKKVDTLTEDSKKKPLIDFSGIEQRLNKIKMAEGFGGAGGFSMGVAVFNVKPIRDYLKQAKASGKHSYLLGVDLNSALSNNYEPFYVSGGFGYGGIGNGFRIGGAGYAAHTLLSLGDTLNLRVAVGYGGVTLTKAFSVNRHNFTLGTMLGAGGMAMMVEASDDSAYLDTDLLGDNYDFDEYDNGKALGGKTALFFTPELHGSYTYSFTSWFHLGVDLRAMGMISYRGFRNDGFVTFNPAGNVRFVFGNLG